MKRFRSCRLLPLLRILALALFALGLVLQPALAAAAEMHELEHDPSGKHGHVMQADDPRADDMGTELNVDEQHGDDAQTLHVLLDFAHCCGVSVAMVTPLNLMPVTPASDPLLIAKVSILLETQLASVFRPPIFR